MAPYMYRILADSRAFAIVNRGSSVINNKGGVPELRLSLERCAHLLGRGRAPISSHHDLRGCLSCLKAGYPQHRWRSRDHEQGIHIRQLAE